MGPNTPQEHIEQPDVGSTAMKLGQDSLPGGQRRVMTDNCAGASVFPRGYDDNAVDDHHVQPVQVEAATGKRSAFSLHDGRSVSIRDSEADVKFPTVRRHSKVTGSCSVLEHNSWLPTKKARGYKMHRHLIWFWNKA